MPTTYPLIRIDGGAPGVKAIVSAASSVECTLDSIAGVHSVEWSIASTDETSVPADYTLVQSGTKGETVTFTSLGVGTAALISATVNSGVDNTTGSVSPLMTTTSKFAVNLNGYEVAAMHERFEADPEFGWLPTYNKAIRGIAVMAAAAPETRILTAGAGLTGGGDLTADRTFDVVANADGSIVVNANDIQLRAAYQTLLDGATANPTGDKVLVRGAAGQGYVTYVAPQVANVGTLGFLRTTSATQVVIAANDHAGLTFDGAEWILGSDVATDWVSVVSATNGFRVKDTGSGNEFFAVDRDAEQVRIGLGETIYHNYVTPVMFQALNGSPGVGDGATWTWTAQRGRQQDGSNDNNHGGSIEIIPGSPGLGGSGASGNWGNIALGGAGSYGSGARVVFLRNCTGVPTTNPTGGLVLYSDGGGLHSRGTNGVETTIAPSGTAGSVQRLLKGFVCLTTSDDTTVATRVASFPSQGVATIHVTIMATRVATGARSYFSKLLRAHRPGAGVAVVDEVVALVPDFDASSLTVDAVSDGAENVDVTVRGLAATTFTWSVIWRLELYAT